MNTVPSLSLSVTNLAYFAVVLSATPIARGLIVAEYAVNVIIISSLLVTADGVILMNSFIVS